ncbi:MAG: hypothetical protein CO126_08665 [Hydrogenophilales bacterium CG_4_9_14_3_um_filter_63_34]|nr:MAG: hypothetical protein CO126_08665 [Hydrogenophilales bacterium CG_4_9_14_3_um_filter_63_34]
MQRIVAGITSLDQHEQAIDLTPDLYRPKACPHCGSSMLWAHGSYSRKADLCNRGEANRNPVPVLRFCCAACRHTCSRLPECIAPRRWYNWLLQQSGLRAVLDPAAPAAPAMPSCPTPARRTLGRWHAWLQERDKPFRFLLTSRFPDLGRVGDGAAFWLGVFDTLGLSQAMAWCGQAVSVP